MVQIEVLRDWAMRWYIRLRARNGELLVHSESYYSKANAMRAARRLSGMLDTKHKIEVLSGQKDK